jgi:L-threonylcarbamoyladenylate synthase
MKYRHYAPKAPVTVVCGDPEKTAAYIQTHLAEGMGVICFTEFSCLFEGFAVETLGPASDKSQQAQRVFDALRAFDSKGVTGIFAQCPDAGGLGMAVANRLKKAAGFCVVEVCE